MKNESKKKPKEMPNKQKETKRKIQDKKVVNKQKKTRI